MSESEFGMKPIWFFVGLILMSIGMLITISGIYHLLVPPITKTVLAETHPDIWWGIVMVIFGTVMFMKTRKQSI